MAAQVKILKRIKKDLNASMSLAEQFIDKGLNNPALAAVSFLSACLIISTLG